MQKGIDYIGVGVGVLVFNKDGRVLIAKRGEKARNEKGKWEFPGGSVEFGERCEDAAKREIKEEFDIDIEIIDLLDVVNHIIPQERQHWVSPSFLAKHISGDAKVMESEKISDFKWVKISELDMKELTIASQNNLRSYNMRIQANETKLTEK